MAKAKAKGRIHEVFKTQLQELAEQATKIAAGIDGDGQRVWQIPSALTGSPLDIPSVSQGFDRSEINTNFEEVLADGASPGTVGDVVALTTQVDYIAVFERAFRARHATPVRCLAHAAARRAGHGKDKGIFQGGLMNYVQAAIAAGSAPPAEHGGST